MNTCGKSSTKLKTNVHDFTNNNQDFIINNIKIKWFDAEKLCVVNRMQLWHAGCYIYYRAYTTERAKEIFFCLCVKRIVILFYQYVFIELHLMIWLFQFFCEIKDPLLADQLLPLGRFLCYQMYNEL